MHTKPDFVISEPTWYDYFDSSAIAENHNHVFQISLAECFISIAGNLKAVVSGKEIEKATRFKNDQDAQRYLATRYILRKLISNTTGQHPALVSFNEGKNRKPIIDGIEFNISHSANSILIALSSGPIGIDVEHINRHFDYQELIPHCFDLDEQRFINTATHKSARFYALWTRKEAILKATGEGLIDDLTALNCLSPEYKEAGYNFRVQTYILGPDYVFTLASSQIAKTIFWNYQTQNPVYANHR
ncbi:4'-phosphopantetheinyl transferase family protein [Pedobacter frigidisoli]|uniref:4'-phosphopantetheinyl transferase family protein n=1 Tax=Pedobacter frigidisoli TaxID=2530455 RepID=UPI00292E955B|nr:4'-phosphopantetheinyl transferase superfamily protein [Pedobacter frigidisoli]